MKKAFTLLLLLGLTAFGVYYFFAYQDAALYLNADQMFKQPCMTAEQFEAQYPSKCSQPTFARWVHFCTGSVVQGRTIGADTIPGSVYLVAACPSATDLSDAAVSNLLRLLLVGMLAGLGVYTILALIGRIRDRHNAKRAKYYTDPEVK